MIQLLRGLFERPVTAVLTACFLVVLGAAMSAGVIFVVALFAVQGDGHSVFRMPVASELIQVVNFIMICCLVILIALFTGAQLRLGRATATATERIDVKLAEDAVRWQQVAQAVSEIRQAAAETRVAAGEARVAAADAKVSSQLTTPAPQGG